MAPLPLRVRLFGALIRRLSVVRLTDEQVVARQSQGLGHNPVLDRFFGGLAKGVDVTNTSTQTPDGSVDLRVYRPTGAERLPLVVFFHGGGWVGGDLDGYDWLASQMTLGAQVVVVSVAYRLAPTHRWPGPVDDCYAALLDAVARSEEWNADASRLAVVGDSAGGNLAAVVALKARDEGGPRIAFQGLTYPSTDMLSDAPSFTENAHAPILDRARPRPTRSTTCRTRPTGPTPTPHPRGLRTTPDSRQRWCRWPSTTRCAAWACATPRSSATPACPSAPPPTSANRTASCPSPASATARPKPWPNSPPNYAPTWRSRGLTSPLGEGSSVSRRGGR